MSCVLLGFLAWSLLILHNQKKTWKAFAAKHKLRYRTKATMDSPEIDGSIDGFKVDIFTSEHVAEGARSNRKLTAIEVSLHSVLPIDGAIASGGMVQLVKELGFKTEIKPEHELWNSSYVAAADNGRALKAYLNPERLDALLRMMRIKNSWMILIFRAERLLLRIDTPDPLTSEDYLSRLVDLMVKSAKALELKNGESAVLEREEAKGMVEESDLKLDDEGFDEESGLSLEDDSASSEPEADADAEDAESEPEKPAEEKKKTKKKKATKKADKKA